MGMYECTTLDDYAMHRLYSRYSLFMQQSNTLYFKLQEEFYLMPPHRILFSSHTERCVYRYVQTYLLLLSVYFHLFAPYGLHFSRYACLRFTRESCSHFILMLKGVFVCQLLASYFLPFLQLSFDCWRRVKHGISMHPVEHKAQKSLTEGREGQRSQMA